MQEKTIPFSPPDISDAEIEAVVQVLKSGWITTGPKTKEFEKQLAAYCGCEKAICLNSATAGLELVLRLLEIGPEDEVITTPYTFAASANVIVHTGARPVFVDVKKGGFNIGPGEIAKAITPRTKAVIPVDIGGWPCDYEEIKAVLEENRKKYHPKRGTLQESFHRPVILSDAAHSFGAAYQGKKIGNAADFTVFSFHAVKNLTTAEGGAVVFNSFDGFSSDEVYRLIKLFSLHGQSKDALSKLNPGDWQYSIELPGYKTNMADIAAAIGLEQLKRYDKELVPKRKLLFEAYINQLQNDSRFILPPFEDNQKINAYHLFMLRIRDTDEQKRTEIIQKMAEKKIAVNVHFIPVVMHPAYTKLGHRIDKYPHTYEMYQNEITLPLYTKLSLEDVEIVCDAIKSCV
jgi:dTDP-4-amino-4,6-dideoxygalactose transaminase